MATSDLAISFRHVVNGCRFCRWFGPYFTAVFLSRLASADWCSWFLTICFLLCVCSCLYPPKSTVSCAGTTSGGHEDDPTRGTVCDRASDRCPTSGQRP